MRLKPPATAASLDPAQWRHAAAINLKAVPGIGAEIVLTVDGEMRRTRLMPSSWAKKRSSFWRA